MVGCWPKKKYSTSDSTSYVSWQLIPKLQKNSKLTKLLCITQTYVHFYGNQQYYFIRLRNIISLYNDRPA